MTQFDIEHSKSTKTPQEVEGLAKPVSIKLVWYFVVNFHSRLITVS